MLIPSPLGVPPPTEFSGAPPAAASCLTCRALGTTTFLGVTAYLLHETSLAKTRPHRAVLLLGSAGSLAMAYLRWRT
jgi:hypothetical protein